MEQERIWNYFQNVGDEVDYFSGAESRYKFIAKHIISGSNALNIGVGRGGLEAILLDKKVVVSSLDPDKESIERIRGLYKLGKHAQVGYSQNIPFRDAEFDVVVMSEVLEHLKDETLSATLDEVRRVLRPGGVFIGTVPANENLADNIAICPHCASSFHRWGHVQSFTAGRLSELLSGKHFMVKTLETRAFPDWERRGFKNIAKSTIRYVLGRMGSPISHPHLFFRALR